MILAQPSRSASRREDVPQSVIAAATALRHGRIGEAEQIARAILARNANDVNALRILADVAAHAGRFHEAEQLLRRIIDLAPDFAFARQLLALILHRQARSGEALNEIAGLKASGGAPASEDLRAAALTQVGEHAEAIRLYRKILLQRPDDARVLLSLGHLLMIVGDVDGAIANYRAAIDQSPGSGEAWWSLANLKTYRFTTSEISRMESALKSAELDDSERLQLHFALGKAFEDRAEYEKSFEQYRRGNSIRSAEIQYDPSWATALVDNSTKLFTRDFLGERSGSGHPAPDPIFIVGMPRSGSTLLEQILGAHPLIEATGELPDLLVLVMELEPKDRAPPAEGGAYPGVVATIPDAQLRTLGARYLERTRIQRKSDRPFFVDKMPNNWQHIGLIRMILPRAKIIDARRHPLACCWSNYKQHFAHGQGFTYDLSNVGRTYRDYVRLMDHFDDAAPGAVHRVIHERLVTHPEDEIRRLLNFIGVPFAEECLRAHQIDRPVRTASAEQVRRPINAEGLEQWRAFEPWLRPLKEALGPALHEWDRTAADI